MSADRSNDQQLAFAEAYVLGSGNATQAAIQAGYSAVSARQTASRLLRTPHVQEAIRRAQAHVLRNRLASKALGVLEKVLDDDDAPAGVRVDAAKTVLDRAGLSAARVPDSVPDDNKGAAEMSLAELDAVASRLALAMRMARGEVIDVEPSVFADPARALPEAWMEPSTQA